MSPWDQDYVEDKKRVIYCVLGCSHPPGRIIAYPKYVYTGRGGWRGYERVSTGCGADAVYSGARGYTVYDPYFDAAIPCVDENRVTRFYPAKEGLKRLLGGPRSGLRGLAAELAERLSEEAGIPLSRFGITGSLLLGIENEAFSDIDLVVYGYREALAVRNALLNALYPSDSLFHRVPRVYEAEEVAKISSAYGVSLEDAKRVYRLKWSRGMYKGRLFTVVPVPGSEGEIPERYGEATYRLVGVGTYSVELADDKSMALFYPSRVRVKKCRCISGPRICIAEVVSYDRLLGYALHEARTAIVRGAVQVVTSGTCSYYRLALGVRECRGWIRPRELEL